VQVIRDTGGVLDFSAGNLLATIAVAAAGVTHHQATMDEVYGHGEQVRLAARAVTADGGISAAARTATVAADALAPDPVDYVEAQQV